MGERTTVTRKILAAVLMLGAASASAQTEYPTRQVRVIVNVTPGGGVDTATRIVAQGLAERLKQTFIIENRGTGGGNPAAEAVYNATPDGYTLLSSPGSTITVNDFLFKKLGFDPVKFGPVAVLTEVPLVLVVRQNFPANNAQEFLAYLKANPGKTTYGAQTLGSPAHLTAELFITQTGHKLTHVPYRGTAPLQTDLLAGQLDMTFIQYSSFLELHRTGKVKILAAAADRRIEALPDVPTMTELGFPDILSRTWNAISAPPKTPPTVLGKLNRLIDEIVKEPEARARFAKLQVTPVGGDLAATRKFLADDRALWAKVIKAANIQPE
jgi:tripartite-type tricarboxylate transporter receptor subunit TctC